MYHLLLFLFLHSLFFCNILLHICNVIGMIQFAYVVTSFLCLVAHLFHLKCKQARLRENVDLLSLHLGICLLLQSFNATYATRFKEKRCS